VVWKFANPMKEKSIFRAYRYPKDYNAFRGIELERLQIDIE
jgi:hypothetical protein